MKTKLNNEKKTIIILGLFFIAILLIIFGVILPTIKYIEDLNINTTNLKGYLEKKYENTHTLKISKAKTEDIKKQTVDYHNHLFYHGDELKLINVLENLATTNSLEQKIEDSDLGKNNGEAVHISLVLTGDYYNIIKYIFDLEKNDYFIQIKHIEISPFVNVQNPDISSQQKTTVNLELLLYVSQN